MANNATSTVGGNGNYVPRWCETKMFVKDRTTRNGALELSEVKKVVELVMQKIPQNLLQYIDTAKTMRFGGRIVFTKVLLWFNNDVTRDDKWKVRDAIVQIYDKGNTINGSSPKVVIEAPLQRKAMYAAGAKCRELLVQKGLPVELIRTEWGPSVRVCYLDGGRHQELASWDSSRGWGVQEKKLQQLLNDETLTAASMIAALK